MKIIAILLSTHFQKFWKYWVYESNKMNHIFRKSSLCHRPTIGLVPNVCFGDINFLPVLQSIHLICVYSCTYQKYTSQKHVYHICIFSYVSQHGDMHIFVHVSLTHGFISDLKSSSKSSEKVESYC